MRVGMQVTREKGMGEEDNLSYQEASVHYGPEIHMTRVSVRSGLRSPLSHG